MARRARPLRPCRAQAGVSSRFTSPWPGLSEIAFWMTAVRRLMTDDGERSERHLLVTMSESNSTLRSWWSVRRRIRATADGLVWRGMSELGRPGQIKDLAPIQIGRMVSQTRRFGVEGVAERQIGMVTPTTSR